jgi:Fe-Mn family superoxide dismutase
MNKREFLKKSTIIGLGGMAIAGTPLKSFGSGIMSGDEDRFKFPKLDYAYDALEPYIDARTMELHYSKHHAGYTKKFNAAVKEAGISGDLNAKAIFKHVSEYPAGVMNNGGGYYNHKLFWKVMSPNGGGEPKGDLLKAIEKAFGSFDKFREKFSKAAATQFGSGWAWLVFQDDKLVVTQTSNQVNPLMDVADVKGIPLLNLDVWEHAYYLKYQNRRTEYIENWWNVVNWDFVAKRFNTASSAM